MSKFKSMEGLVKKGKLEGKINGPVYALGAGFYSQFARGPAGMMEGIIGPTQTSGPFGMQAGKIQFHGGYYLPDGSPTRAKQSAGLEGGSGKAKAKAWFMQSSIPEAARAAQDLRNFLKLPDDSRVPSMIELMQANMALDQERYGVQDVDTLLEKKPEEFDLNAAIENSDGRNQDTWRRLQHVIKNIPKASSNQRGYEAFQNRLARVFLPGGKGGTASTLSATSEHISEVIPRERTRIYQLQKEYNTLAASNTSSLLSLLNSRVQREDGWVKAEEKNLPIVTDAANVEEQHAVLREYGAQPLSPPEPTGNTGTMDFAYSMYGNIVVGDVSDMEIATGYHHGLSRGRIMTATEIKQAIQSGIESGADGEGGEIRDKIYNYWKKYALPDANRTIHAIKKRAKSTYHSSKPSPEQMRNPFGLLGRRTDASFGVHERGDKWNPGQNVRGQALRDISTSTEKMLKKLKPALGHWVKGASAQTAMTLSNHMLGTWQQHAGAIFHNITVSKDPHLTAELFLQAYDKGPHQYKFKVKAFQEEHVRVNAGYAVLNMLQRAGQITQRQKGNIIYEMKAAQLGRSIKGVGNSVTAGRVNEVQSSNVTNTATSGILNASLEFYLPANAEQEIYRNILKNFKNPQDLVEYDGSIQNDLQSIARRKNNNFNVSLSNRQSSLRRDGFFFPHLTTLWSAPYIAMIRQR